MEDKAKLNTNFGPQEDYDKQSLLLGRKTGQVNVIKNFLQQQMGDKADTAAQAQQYRIEMDRLEQQDNKLMLASNRKYEKDKKGSEKTHWEHELQQAQDHKGAVPRDNDVVWK